MITRVGSACIALALGTGVALAGAVADGSQDRERQLKLRACPEIIAGSGFWEGAKAVAHRNHAIIAYIHSLSIGKAEPPAVKAKTVVPIADAVDVGDAPKGLTYAQRVCSGCHNILRTEADSPNKDAPPFKTIANTPGMSITALTVWSRTPHAKMPNLIIDPADMDNVIAYILSLRDRQ